MAGSTDSHAGVAERSDDRHAKDDRQRPWRRHFGESAGAVLAGKAAIQRLAPANSDPLRGPGPSVLSHCSRNRELFPCVLHGTRHIPRAAIVSSGAVNLTQGDQGIMTSTFVRSLLVAGAAVGALSLAACNKPAATADNSAADASAAANTAMSAASDANNSASNAAADTTNAATNTGQ
jgi:hypothetical protein